MTCLTQLFYHRLDGKPYQSSAYMVVLHSLFGELTCRGVKYSLAKDFNYRSGFMRDLEHCWNQQTLMASTFAARPTKVKMPKDYARIIRAAVKQGLLDPVKDVDNCQLLFACACGTLLGFCGNQVRFWWIVDFFVVDSVFVISSSHVDLFCVTLLLQEHYGLRFSDFGKGFYNDNHPSMLGMAYLELKG
jgi:hypothetical protein